MNRRRSAAVSCRRSAADGGSPATRSLRSVVVAGRIPRTKRQEIGGLSRSSPGDMRR